MSLFLTRQFSLVIAIDFGTSRSGYAYTFTNKGKNITQDLTIMGRASWPDQPYSFPKTLTELLYAPNGVSEAWGYSARIVFAHQRQQANKGYDFVRNFKMDLYNQKKPQSVGALGKTYNTIDLIVDYLKAIKTLVLEDVTEKTAGNLRHDDILWCLTVPAIWRDKEKDLMRLAAQRAGLISDKSYDQDRLLLALEPEAAAFYCQYNSQVDLPPGSRFMIIDCGGGTADITTSEITNTRRLKEIAVGGGGPYGSLAVDKQFFTYLRQKLAIDVLDRFSESEPIEYQSMIAEWERTKCSFDPERHDTMFFSIPSKLYKFLSKEYPDILARLDKEQGEDDKIHISRDVMLSFFEPALKGIVSEIQKQFKQLTTTKCDYMFLVGGFSASPVLRTRIKQEFGTLVKSIVTPNSPGGAIVEGAVIFALDPARMVSRIARRTYGCDTSKPFRTGIDPESKKTWKDNKTPYCQDRFSVFVEIGQEITVDKEVVQTFSPLRADQTVVGFQFYATPSSDPTYVDEPGSELLGTLRIPIPDTRYGANRQFKTTMYFGQTEIRVIVIDEPTGKEFETKLDYGHSV